jgi:methyl-accepting chemotaxis protein
MSQAMGQMDQVTQRNAAAAQELSSTAVQLASQAQGLRALMAVFRLDDASEERESQFVDHNPHSAELSTRNRGRIDDDFVQF